MFLTDLCWSLVLVLCFLCRMQLQWVAMQATGRLPFTSVLYAGHLHGRLYIRLLLRYAEPGIPGEVASWKSQTAFSNRPDK